MLKSAAFTLAAFLAVSAFAGQDLQPGQQYFKGNKNIILPASGVLKPGHRRTHYLIYNGPKKSLSTSPLYAGSIGLQSGIPGYKPADILAAYNIPANAGSGAIAIVDAFDLPTSLADFNFFSSTFGLPTEPSTVATASSNKVFQVVYANGVKPNPDKGWGGEIALDIEWAHAIAPKAKIYLVEAASSSDTDLYFAEQIAATLVGVKQISNSWGGGESSQDLITNDTVFPDKNGVTYFVSSGDVGGVQEYPSESPNVVAVGGTSLIVSGGVFKSETAWSDAGGGPSQIQARPSYQDKLASVIGATRGCPDVAAVADPNTGCAVYSTYAIGGWEQVGGTSLACPVMAAITNVRGQFSKGTGAEHTRIYGNYLSKYYRDITQGQAGSFPAQVGYDFVTGIGTAVGLYAPVTNATYNATGDPFLFTGTKIGGTAASLAAADTDWYYVTTSQVAGLGQVAGFSVDFNIGKTLASFNALQLNIVAQTTDFATVQIFGYDWTTQSYRIIKALPGSSTATSTTLDITSYPNMVSSTGAIRYYVRAFQPLRYGAGSFTFGVNQFSLSGSVATN